MKAKIYLPTKSAMQSGKANTKKWQLEFDAQNTRFIEPLMGWTANSDTKQQLKLSFDSKEDAIAYAQRNNLEFRVIEPKTSKIKIQAYSDNFT